MSTFSELCRVGHMEALRFFFTELTDLVSVREGVTKQETLYVASILAHYAQTSRSEEPLADLVEFFDYFVLDQITRPQDPKMFEMAGAQSLLFGGFFGDQMRRRHNLHYYEFLGASFYERASNQTKSKDKKILLGLMSCHFPVWARHCRGLSRNLRENRFLIKPPKILEP